MNDHIFAVPLAFCQNLLLIVTPFLGGMNIHKHQLFWDWQRYQGLEYGFDPWTSMNHLFSFYPLEAVEWRPGYCPICEHSGHSRICCPMLSQEQRRWDRWDRWALANRTMSCGEIFLRKLIMNSFFGVFAGKCWWFFDWEKPSWSIRPEGLTIEYDGNVFGSTLVKANSKMTIF